MSAQSERLRQERNARIQFEEFMQSLTEKISKVHHDNNDSEDE